MHEPPVIVEPGPPGRLTVRFAYTAERVEKIKTIPGRRWDADNKQWSVPDSEGLRQRLLALLGEAPPKQAPPRHAPAALMTKVSAAIRARHFSPRTESSYSSWIRRFLELAGLHPEALGEAEVGRFLSSLAVEGQVAASTQNQALNALLFLYKNVLGKELGLLEGVVRAKRPQRVPIVLAKEEVRRVLTAMSGTPRLMASLLYGAGLRLLECCQLRVKDLDFAQNQIVVRAGKGNKDRYTMLPSGAKDPLLRHLEDVKKQHDADLLAGSGSVALPNALARKYPSAPKEWGWQWVFPATSHYTDSATGERRRHHLHETVLQRAFREARIKAGIAKPAG